MISSLNSLKTWLGNTISIDRWSIMPPDTVAEGTTVMRPPTSAFFETSKIDNINLGQKAVQTCIEVSVMYRFLSSTPYNDLPIIQLSSLQAYLQWLFLSTSFVNCSTYNSTPKPIDILKESVGGDAPDTIIRMPLSFNILAQIETPTEFVTPVVDTPFALRQIDIGMWKSIYPAQKPGSYRDTKISITRQP